MRRFLVVDDSPTVRLMLKAAIAKAAGEGATVEEAENADAALEAFHRTEPEVVFLDMMLAQGSTGSDALRRMLGERPEARVVVVTGLPPGHPEVVEAISQGAFGFLQKPVRSDAVREVLDAVRQESGEGQGRIR